MKSTILSAGVIFAVFTMISCALTDDSPMPGTQAEPCAVAKGGAMNNASLPQDAHLVTFPAPEIYTLNLATLFARLIIDR